MRIQAQPIQGIERTMKLKSKTRKCNIKYCEQNNVNVQQYKWPKNKEFIIGQDY